MSNNLNNVPLRIRLLTLYALIFILVGAIIVGSVVFLKTVEYLLGVPVSDAQMLFSALEHSPNAQEFLLIAQALTALISFVLIPLLVIILIWPHLLIIFKPAKVNFSELVLLSIFLTIASFPLIAFLSEWNQAILIFPDSMKPLEAWMKNSEQEAEKLTNMLAYYSNAKEMLGGLLVIAILPAIGEELLFRGLIQTQLMRVFKNPHASIFLTGFLFSFIHFQFFGFFPRMFLGVIFGYLFFWSGTLWVPVAMHFTNNALTYFALNFYKQHKMNFDVESSKDLPIASFFVSLLICLLIIFRFYSLTNRKEQIAF